MDPQTQRFVEMQGEIKALREELHRQRTQLLSAEIMNQQNHFDRHHEENLINVQNECDHYKKLVKDASTRFKEIHKASDLNAALSALIEGWFELIEKVFWRFF